MADLRAEQAKAAADAILNALSRNKKADLIGEINTLFLYLERKAAEERK